MCKRLTPGVMGGILPAMETMINGRAANEYIGATEASRRIGKARETITRLCRYGEIPGAFQFRGEWLIPVDSLAASSLQRPRGRPPQKNQRDS